jgi:hypothetical protein
MGRNGDFREEARETPMTRQGKVQPLRTGASSNARYLEMLVEFAGLEPLPSSGRSG